MIYLATDHAGFAMKEEIKAYLGELGHAVHDFGSYEYDQQDDYPDYISLAADAVSANPEEHKAIIFGGSGQGEAMLANTYKGVRAAVYYGGNLEIVKLSREHNDANVLSLGARFMDVATAQEAVHMWLGTEFSNDERHVRRLNKFS